jgi:DNA-directed RNA polymerase beta' subunit
MIKIMEDLMVRNDRTVRNSIGSVIEFAYGDDNLDATQTVLIDGEPQAVDIGRLADRLNLNYELEKKKKK